MKHEVIIEEFFRSEKIKKCLNDIYQNTGIPITISSFNGLSITNDNYENQEVCEKFHWKVPEHKQLCLRKNFSIFEEEIAEGKNHYYNEPFGMKECLAPIFYQGKHIINIIIGQIFFEKPDLEYFRKQAQKYGFEEFSYIPAIRKVPIFDNLVIETNLFFLSNYTNLIIELLVERKTIQNSLQIEEEFKNIFNLSVDMICIADLASSQILKVNPAFTKTLGYSTEEIQGQSFFNFIHPDDIQKTKNIISEKLEIGEEVFDFVNRYRDKSGNYRWLEWVANPIPEKKYTYAIAHDITEKKITEEVLIQNEQRFRNIFEKGPLGMAICDMQFKMLKVNDIACQYFGYSEAELLKMRVPELTHPDFLENNILSLKEIIEGKREVYQTTKKYIRKDKKEIWGEVFVSAIRDSEGRFQYFLALINNITLQKEAEIAIADSEKKYKAIIQNSPVGMLVIRRGRIVFGNSVVASIFEYESVEELFGEYILRFAKEKYLRTIKEMFEFLNLNPGSILEANEVEVLTKNMNTVDVIIAGYASEYEGEPAVNAYMIDVSRMKKTEKELAKTQMMYNSLIETSQDLVWRCDIEGRYTFLSKSWEGVLGYKIEELIGKRFSDFMASEMSEKDIKLFTRLIEKDQSIKGYETEHIHKKGFPVSLMFNAVTIKNSKGEVVGTQGSAQDITQRKQYEQILKEKSDRLEQAQRIGKVGDFVYDIEKDNLHWSKQQYKNFGVEDSSIVPTLENFYQLVRVEDRERIRSYVNKAIRNDEKGQYEFGLITPKGKIKYFETNIEVTKAEDGKTKYLSGTTREISDRKKIELELKENEYFLKQAQKIAKVGHYSMDVQKGVWFSSEVLDSIFGIDINFAKDVSGWLQIVYDDDKKMMLDYFTNEVIGKQKNFDKEYRISRIDTSEIRWVHGLGELDINKKGEVVSMIGTIQDITERIQAQFELQNLAKLESLGSLASGIAHNFKNILASVSLNVGFAKIRPENIVTYLDRIESGVEQAADLARRFQTFSTGGEPIKEVISVTDLLNSVSEMVLSGKNHTTIVSCQDNLYNIEADSKQISEVITNLFLNSVDAMSLGGEIIVNAENELIEDFKQNVDPGKYVKITIEDSGVGIPDEIKNKIFDPFFSTKGMNRGLGLSSSYFIVERHNGLLSFDSKVGKGTKFKILLPATVKAVDRKDDSESTMKGGNIRILFMDDDDDIRENIKEFSEILEFSIDTAKDGEEAIDLYKKSLEDIQKYELVILDLTIQGSQMQGEDVLKELKNLDADVRAVVFSGHSNKPIVANYEEYGFIGRLEKPVSIKKLSQMLNELCK